MDPKEPGSKSDVDLSAAVQHRFESFTKAVSASLDIAEHQLHQWQAIDPCVVSLRSYGMNKLRERLADLQKDLSDYQSRYAGLVSSALISSDTLSLDGAKRDASVALSDFEKSVRKIDDQRARLAIVLDDPPVSSTVRR